MNLNKIKDILAGADFFTETDRSELVNLLKSVEDKDLAELAELAEGDAYWLKKILENYRKKKKAASLDDKKLWLEILKEEQAELESLKKSRILH